MNKKFLALAIVLVMIISLLPLTTFAYEGTPSPSVKVRFADPVTKNVDIGMAHDDAAYIILEDVVNEETGEVIGNKPVRIAKADVPETGYIKVSYYNGTARIVLNNIHYKRSAAHDSAFISLYENSVDAATLNFDSIVELVGTNTIEGTKAGIEIKNTGTVTFTGSGSLFMDTPMQDRKAAIWAVNCSKLVFLDTTVSVDMSGGANGVRYGIVSRGDVEIDGATLTITSDYGNCINTRYKSGAASAYVAELNDSNIYVKNNGTLNITNSHNSTGMFQTKGTVNFENANVDLTNKNTKTSTTTGAYSITSKAPYITGTYSVKKASKFCKTSSSYNLLDWDTIETTAGVGINGGDQLKMGSTEGVYLVRAMTLVHAHSFTTKASDKLVEGTTSTYYAQCDGCRAVSDDVYVQVGGSEPECEHEGGTATCQEKATCDLCGLKYGDYAPHTPNDDDGDCTSAITCSVCGEVTTEAMSKHTYVEGVCSNCNTSCTHANTPDQDNCAKAVNCPDCGIVVHPAKSHQGGTPTCTTHRKCEVCGNGWGALAPHTPGEAVLDTETNELVTSCTVCQTELSREPAPEPECTHANTPAQEYCDVAVNCPDCGEEVYAAKAHTEGAAADCENDQICTVCEKVLVEKLGHTPGAAADCENDQVCTVCGEKLADKLGHTPGAAADCENDQVCTVCGEKLADKLGHTPGAAADCENDQVCTVCGEKLADKLGHTPGAAADCENDQICTVCEKVLVEKLGHKPGTPVKENEVPATLNAPGSYEEVISCSVCKEELSRVKKDIPELTGAVCQTNDGVKFATLAEAVAHRDPVLITLLDNVTLTERITISGTVGIELNGFNITGNVADQYGMFYVRKGAELNLIGEGTVENTAGVTIGNYGHVLVGENVTVNCAEDYASVYNFYYTADYYGHATINGKAAVIWNSGTLQVNETAQIAYLDNSGYANVINGAVVETFYAQDGSDAPEVPDAGCFRYAEPSKVILDEGYVLITVKEATYKVHAHTYETNTTAPTCTDEGYTTYTCACGDTYDADKVPAKGHTPGAAATCTTNQTCTECGKELAPAKGHTYGNLQVFSFCEEEGYIIIGCNKCGGQWDSRTDKEAQDYLASPVGQFINIKPQGHKPGAEADCLNAQICTVCEKELAPAKGHRWGGLVVTPATCTEDGDITITCGNCGKVCTKADPEGQDYLASPVGQFINIKAKGHKYETDVTDATCTENGKTVYTCACGDTYEEPIVSEGHNYIKGETFAPTHTAKGYTVYTCDKCGDSYQGDFVNKLSTAAKNETTGKLYSSLQEAIDEAADGETVALTKSVKNAATLIVPANKKITIDLKGFYYAVKQVEQGTALVVETGAEVTLKGTGAAKLEAMYVSRTAFQSLIENKGKLTVENVNLYGPNLTNEGAATIINAGIIALNDGTVVGFYKTALVNTGSITKAESVELAAPEGYHWSAEGVLEAHSYTKTSIPATCVKVSYDLHECSCGASYEDNYGTKKLSIVAKIGDQYYASMAEAIAAAKENDVIVLFKNVKNAETIIVTSGKKITIDLNGKYYAVNQITGKAALIVEEGAELILTGGGKIEAQSISGNKDAFDCVIENNGKLKLENVLVYASNLYATDFAIINNGELTKTADTVISLIKASEMSGNGTVIG